MLISGEGSLPGLQTAAFSCLGERREQVSGVVPHQGATRHEGPTLLTSSHPGHLPKDPLRTPSYWRSGLRHLSFRGHCLQTRSGGSVPCWLQGVVHLLLSALCSLCPPPSLTVGSWRAGSVARVCGSWHSHQGICQHGLVNEFSVSVLTPLGVVAVVSSVLGLLAGHPLPLAFSSWSCGAGCLPVLSVTSPTTQLFP